MYTVQGLGQTDIACVTRVKEQIVREQVASEEFEEAGISWLPLLLLGLGLYAL